MPELPAGAHWQYEPKWDGFRCLAFKDADEVYQYIGKLFEDLVKWIWGGRIRSIPTPDLFSGSVTIFAATVNAMQRVEEIRERVRADGITHLLVRHDILQDYERSPIVDERRPREENVAKLALMTAFFTEGTRMIKGDQKFWLIELPPARGR